MLHISNDPNSRVCAPALWLGLFLAIAFVTNNSSAQTSPAAAPQIPQTFEVASIRMVSPHSLDDLVKGVGVYSVCTYPTSRFFVHNAPLRIILSMILDGSSDHVAGPDWLDSQQYSIDAKVEGDKQLSNEEMKPLLRSMLEERLHLQSHRETRSGPGYALVSSKSGPKLSPSKDEAAPHGQFLPGHLQAWHISVQNFAAFLSKPVGRPVVDKTGIEGAYDFDLRFAPANDPGSNLPDIFTAVQEQFGLKLESQKVPVDFLVIEHVDRIPTEN